MYAVSWNSRKDVINYANCTKLNAEKWFLSCNSNKPSIMYCLAFRESFWASVRHVLLVCYYNEDKIFVFLSIF